MDITITINADKVRYTYTDNYDGSPDPVDLAHIESLISQGFTEGELLTVDPTAPFDIHPGWWTLLID